MRKKTQKKRDFELKIPENSGPLVKTLAKASEIRMERRMKMKKIT